MKEVKEKDLKGSFHYQTFFEKVDIENNPLDYSLYRETNERWRRLRRMVLIYLFFWSTHQQRYLKNSVYDMGKITSFAANEDGKMLLVFQDTSDRPRPNVLYHENIKAAPQKEEKGLEVDSISISGENGKEIISVESVSYDASTKAFDTKNKRKEVWIYTLYYNTHN